MQWERTIAGYIVEVIEPIAMLAVIGLAFGCRSRQQPQGFLDFCQHRACTYGSQAAKQCDHRMDRSDGSGYLCVAGVSDVGASGGRLDAGLEPLVPASVAKHRCGGRGAGGRRDHRRRDPFGERDKRQPARVDRVVCRDRRAHCPQRTNADPGARHVSLDHGRAIRRRAARSDRRAGHLVSVRYRRVADAVRLRDRHPAPGLFDRANLAFQRERIDRAAEIGGAGRHVDADRRRDRQHDARSAATTFGSQFGLRSQYICQPRR